MKFLTTLLLALFVAMVLPVSTQAKEYQEGKEYLLLSSPQPTSTGDKVEVVELFWYGCPHCYDLEPVVKAWLQRKPDYVELVRMPAIVGPRWELLAQAYYTAELLGVIDKMHLALFQAVHEKNMKINDEASLEAFFVDQGVSADDFKKTFNSFAVAVKMNNSRQMTRRYKITGVPTVIVNGKYSTGAKLAGSNQGIFEVVDYLVEQERPAAPVAPADVVVN
jgi:protein dithiol oxidoreductase (disulfide-forming)